MPRNFFFKYRIVYVFSYCFLVLTLFSSSCFFLCSLLAENTNPGTTSQMISREEQYAWTCMNTRLWLASKRILNAIQPCLTLSKFTGSCKWPRWTFQQWKDFWITAVLPQHVFVKSFLNAFQNNLFMFFKSFLKAPSTL